MPTNINIVAWRDSILESNLTATEKLVCVALAKFYRPGYEIYPSINKLSVNTSLTERSLYRVLNSLQNKGVITIERKQLKYSKTYHNIYTLLEPKKEYHTPDIESPTDIMSPLTQSRKPLTQSLTQSQVPPDTESETPDTESPEIDYNKKKEKEKEILIQPTAVTTSYSFLSNKKKDDLLKELKKLSTTDKTIIERLYINEKNNELLEYLSACANNGITKSNDQLLFMKQCVLCWGFLRNTVSDYYNTDMDPNPNMKDVLHCFSAIKNSLMGYTQCC